MPSFFQPIIAHIHDLPVLIYPMYGLEEILEREEEVLTGHLQELFAEHDLNEADYMIAILWRDGEDLMSDVWIFAGIETEDTGYIIDCRTFRELAETHGEGITASDGLIMLGREAEHEEGMRKAGQTLHEYLDGERPQLPGEMVGEKWEKTG